jgi:septum site-determining protein MinC
MRNRLVDSTKKPEPGSEDNISIKGRRDGLVVTIGEGEWSELVNQLTRNLKQKAAFFSGAQAILNAGSRELSTEELRQIAQLLSSYGMEICGIRTTALETAEAAAALEIPAEATEVESARTSRPDLRRHQEQETDKALFIRRTIRSGQMVRYPGHITVIGDVNPGAEVVASGDIMIWGKLRGTVHAGAQGDDSAIVCSLFLAPTQLRIGNHIARSPEGEERDLTIPEIARVDEKEIVVEPWNLSAQ